MSGADNNRRGKSMQQTNNADGTVTIGSHTYNNEVITCHRPPTAWEIRFGEGATHYRDFPLLEIVKPDGSMKVWFVADDRLRYYTN